MFATKKNARDIDPYVSPGIVSCRTDLLLSSVAYVRDVVDSPDPLTILLVENQTPNLNALPPRRIRRRLRIHKSRMRRPRRQSLLPQRLALAPRIIALKQHRLIGRHILHVIKPVVLVRRHAQRFALDLVPGSRVVRVRIRDRLLAAVVAGVVVVGARRVHEVDGDEVRGHGGAPVDDGQRHVGGRVFDGSPHVDDLVAPL